MHPQIEAAAVYRATGQLFASYAADIDEATSYPAPPQPSGYRFDGRSLELFQPIDHNGERLGTVYLRARYDVFGRLKDYLAILVAVSLLSLGVAALLFHRLQDAVTRPILAVTQVAQEVVDKRDYSLHVPKETEDEMGVLVDAFNNMLAEVGRRTEALERADRRKDEFLATLAHELRNPLAPLSQRDRDLQARRRRCGDAATRCATSWSARCGRWCG